MKSFYSVIFLVFLSLTCYSQQGSATKAKTISYEKIIKEINGTSKHDHIEYGRLLKLYLEMAKKERNLEHLFDAYNYYTYFEKDITKKHQYVDSLWVLALQLENYLFKVKTYQTNATVYYMEKDFLKSLENDLKALHLINKIKAPYEYYKAMYAIGQTLFYIQEYDEASTYFKAARLYFEKNQDYNHLRGFLNSVRYEAFTAYHLKNYEESVSLIKQGIDRLAQVKEHRMASEKAYFNYIHALNLLQSKDYNSSINMLNEALPEIVKNNDTINQHNLYYYLGVNNWNLNNKEKAISYFEKIDAKFQSKPYSNLETKNAYNYLIDHYKQLKDEKKQLYYTNQLLKVTVFLQNEYRHINSIIHKELGVGHLKNEQKRLEQNLEKKSNLLNGALFLAVLVFIAFTLILIHNQRKKKEYKKRYEEWQEIKLDLEHDAQKNSSSEKSIPLVLGDETLKELLQHLDDFEKQEEFLNENINLNDLADKWNTNRSYLSSCVNKYKEKNFTEYINQLRIDYLLKKLDEDFSKYKCLKIEAIGKDLGFSSARSFSNAFVKGTGISPSFYLNQLAIKMDIY